MKSKLLCQDTDCQKLPFEGRAFCDDHLETNPGDVPAAVRFGYISSTFINFDQLVRDSGRNSAAHGFHEGWNDGEKVALFHSEISEILEELRKVGQEVRTRIPGPYTDGQPNHGKKVLRIDTIYYRPEDGKPEGVPVEIADSIIRLCDFISYYKMTEVVCQALREKMEFNRTRPMKHGKNF